MHTLFQYIIRIELGVFFLVRQFELAHQKWNLSCFDREAPRRPIFHVYFYPISMIEEQRLDRVGILIVQLEPKEAGCFTVYFSQSDRLLKLICCSKFIPSNKFVSIWGFSEKRIEKKHDLL